MSDRLNYYFRQKVTEGELDEGFALLETADRLECTDRGAVGVVTGLQVVQRGAGANLSVDVAAGTAYDKDGARIHITATQNVSVAADESSVSTAVSGVGNSKIISVFAKFKRVLSDPRTDGNSVTVYFSEAESFEFIVRQGAEALSPTPPALDPSLILLADITRIYGGTTVVNGDIDTTASNRREEVYKIAGTPYRIQRGKTGDAISDVLAAVNQEVLDRGAGDIAFASAAVSSANGYTDTKALDKRTGQTDTLSSQVTVDSTGKLLLDTSSELELKSGSQFTKDAGSAMKSDGDSAAMLITEDFVSHGTSTTLLTRTAGQGYADVPTVQVSLNCKVGDVLWISGFAELDSNATHPKIKFVANDGGSDLAVANSEVEYWIVARGYVLLPTCKYVVVNAGAVVIKIQAAGSSAGNLDVRNAAVSVQQHRY